MYVSTLFVCVYIHRYIGCCLCLVTKSCLTLCNSMDCGPPGSSVHGISQATITGVGSHSLLQGLNPSLLLGFHGSSDSKESACNAETWVQPLGWEDPLEKEMATHSSILAWRIPRTDHGVSRSWTGLSN